MTKITLPSPWSFHSIPVTIDFPAGDHDVTDEIAKAAKAAGAVKDENDGCGAAKDRSAKAAGVVEG